MSSLFAIEDLRTDCSVIACGKKLIFLFLLLVSCLTQNAFAQFTTLFRLDKIPASFKLPLECQYRIKIPVYHYGPQNNTQFVYVAVTRISADGFPKPVVDHIEARLSPYDVEMMIDENQKDIFLTQDWRDWAYSLISANRAGSDFSLYVQFRGSPSTSLQLRGDSIGSVNGRGLFYLKSSKAFLEHSCGAANIK